MRRRRLWCGRLHDAGPAGQGQGDDQKEDEIVWGMSLAWCQVKRHQPGCFRGYVPLRRFFRFHAGSRVIPPASCKRICGRSLVLGDLF
jgi:hypothetical protein